MSQIQDLIAELCPGGVEYQALSAVLDYEQPGKYLVESTAYANSFDTPVLTAGQTFILGYTDETEGIYPASKSEPVIIFDDFTTAFKWVDFLFKAKSSAMKMLTPKSGAQILARYVYFAMQTIRYSPQDHARQWISTYSSFAIPVPPLEIQREVVRILDHFTELSMELEAELEGRRRQYANYRTRILDDACQGGDYVQIGNLGRVVTGRTPKSSNILSAWGSQVDFITPSDIENGLRIVSEPARRLSGGGAAAMAKVLIPAGSILVTCIGADMGKTVINANDCVTNQQINAIILNPGIDVGYLFHVLTSMRDSIRQQGERAGGTMPIINKSDFSRIQVPLPGLDAQKAVASKLDTFDALVNDRSVGIPAEVSARRRQYEYYRDRLLAFGEITA